MCLSTRGRAWLWGYHTPRSRHPSSWSRPPLGANTPPPRDGHCCRRYASYWNAFLLIYRSTCCGSISQRKGYTGHCIQRVRLQRSSEHPLATKRSPCTINIRAKSGYNELLFCNSLLDVKLQIPNWVQFFQLKLIFSHPSSSSPTIC